MRIGDGWQAGQRPARLLMLALGTLFAIYSGLYFIAILKHPGPYRFGDFFAFWSYGKLLVGLPATELYQPDALIAHQMALGMPATESNPFPYPPSFMPAMWPLGLLSYTGAYVGFMGLSLALYVAAIVAWAPRPRLPLALAAIVAPGSIVALVAGQTGFLAGALFLGGMQALGGRPLLAGVLLGLLSYKPQLGILVPVALVAAGQFRAIAAAIATIAALALLTSAAFGWHIWADWLAYLPAYAAQFEAQSAGNDFLMPTLTAAGRALGIPPAIFRPAQAVLALAAVIWVWRSFRHGIGPRATLVLATAAFLATPHAFIYDLPMLTGAALLFIAGRIAGGAVVSTGEVLVFVLVLCFPAIMARGGMAAIAGIASLLLLAGLLIAQRPRAPA